MVCLLIPPHAIAVVEFRRAPFNEYPTQPLASFIRPLVSRASDANDHHTHPAYLLREGGWLKSFITFSLLWKASGLGPPALGGQL